MVGWCSRDWFTRGWCTRGCVHTLHPFQLTIKIFFLKKVAPFTFFLIVFCVCVCMWDGVHGNGVHGNGVHGNCVHGIVCVCMVVGACVHVYSVVCVMACIHPRSQCGIDTMVPGLVVLQRPDDRDLRRISRSSGRRVPRRRTRIISVDGAPVGFVQLEPNSTTPAILYIDQPYRCQGVGSTVVRILVQPGMRIVSAPGAVGFWEKMGFRSRSRWWCTRSCLPMYMASNVTTADV
jgi:hypothetical protein